MKLSIIQSELVWENKAANFLNFEKFLSTLYNKTDIVILPEMFSTGFTMNPSALSENRDGETLNWMKTISKDGNFGLCGSYIVSAGDKFYNRWVFVSPEGDYWCYDKRHLFGMEGEDTHFSPGISRTIFNFRGFRISPFICYDLRFPVWSRNRNDYDLAIYAANWPEARINVWDTLMKARAIENQCFVAGSNIIGADGNGIKYCGSSQIINARGEIIASGELNSSCIISAEILLDDLKDFRNKFSVFNDADDFSLSL